MLAENSTEQEVTHQLIYIDAFKADHADEPLLTIVSEILKNETDEKKKTKLIKKAIPVLRTTIKTASKAAISHILRQDTESIAEGYDKEIQKIADKAIDVTVETMLKDHVEVEKNLEALQSILKEIADEKPIVIFIDELDRCRPDFAINMLEVIKHTFDIDNVQFVLVTNMTQLEAAVNHCYGSAVDAKNYLDKFLKFRFTLPTRIMNSYVATKHFKNLVRKSSLINDIFFNKNKNFYWKTLVPHCIEIHNLSLRDVETLVRNIEIYQVITNSFGKNGKTIDFSLELLAVCLFTIQPSIAKDILRDKSDALAIANFLGEENMYQFANKTINPNIRELLCVFLGSDCKINAERFTPLDGDKNWENVYEIYSDGWTVDKGERLTTFTQALSSLSLNTAMVSISRY